MYAGLSKQPKAVVDLKLKLILKDSSMWDDIKSIKVESIGNFMLLFKTCYYLRYRHFGRNLVLFLHWTNSVTLVQLKMVSSLFFLNSNILGISSLSSYDNIYLLNTVAS